MISKFSEGKFQDNKAMLTARSFLCCSTVMPNNHDGGVIGMNALWGGFRVDFAAVRLELE
jgi:hypothetical protein